MECNSCKNNFEKLRAKGYCAKCYYAITSKIWRAKNKEKLKEDKKKYRQENKEKVYLRDKAYREKEGEKLKEKKREYCKNNKNEIKIRDRRYRQDNREKLTALQKAWRHKNPDKMKAHREKARKNPLFQLKKSISNAIRKALKRLSIGKNEKSFRMLGITIEEVSNHRDKFINKPCGCGIFCEKNTILSIDNSHLDHRIPLNEAKTEEDVIRLNQLDNLWWICDKCNLTKSYKIIEEFSKPLELETGEV